MSRFFVLDSVGVKRKSSDVGRRDEPEVKRSGGDPVQDCLLDLRRFLRQNQLDRVILRSVRILGVTSVISEIFSRQRSHLQQRQGPVSMDLVVFIVILSPNLVSPVPPRDCSIWYGGG